MTISTDNHGTNGFGCLLSSSIYFDRLLFIIVLLAGECDAHNMLSTPNHHLPQNIQELCDLLARGIFRLRARETEVEVKQDADRRENSLHFRAHQSGHAKPKTRRTA